MTEEKFSSPHASLQSVLSQLGRLSPRNRPAPLFQTRDTAERVIAVSATTAGTDVSLTPVWGIDHDDLANSEIVAWSVTNALN